MTESEQVLLGLVIGRLPVAAAVPIRETFLSERGLTVEPVQRSRTEYERLSRVRDEHHSRSSA